MLCSVTIAADAIGEGHGLEAHQLVQLHHELVEIVQAHGVLKFGTDGEAEFKRQLRRLAVIAPDAAKEWEVRWSVLRRVNVTGQILPLEQIDDLLILRTNWKGLIDSALASKSRARSLGVPATAFEKRDAASKIEIADFTGLWAIRTYRNLRRMQQNQTVRAGTRRETFWLRRLRPLVRASQHIVVFDKYAGANLLKAQADEFEWLLRHIDRQGTRVTIELVTAVRVTKKGQLPLVQTLEAALSQLGTAVLGGGGVRSLQLRTSPAYGVTRFPHDRHLRFDGSVIELSAGLDRLRTATITETFTATYGWHSAHLKKARDNERSVRTDPAARVREVWRLP